MTRSFYQLALLILIFLQSGCKSEIDLCSGGNRVLLAREELRIALLEDLSEKGIPAQLTDSNEVCYSPEHSAIVNESILKIDLSQRPANQMSISDPILAQMALERLALEGMKYDVTQLTNVTLIQFHDEATARRAIELVNEVTDLRYSQD